jgi:hypothetical protein
MAAGIDRDALDVRAACVDPDRVGRDHVVDCPSLTLQPPSIAST